MTTVPEFAPGCYGSALAFKSDDSVCMGCIFQPQCEPVHRVALATLRTRLGIKTKDTRETEKLAARAAARQAQEPLSPEMLALPKKVQDLVNRLDRGNYDVVGKLQRGENPFGAELKFMRVAAHLLLALAPRNMSMDRDLLTTAFVKHLGWQENTAEAHARQAIQALTHVGAVDNNNGAVILRRTQ